MKLENKELILILSGLLLYVVGAFFAPQEMTNEEKFGIVMVVISMLLVGAGIGISFVIPPTRKEGNK